MKPTNYTTLMIACSILLLSFQSHAKTAQLKQSKEKSTSSSPAKVSTQSPTKSLTQNSHRVFSSKDVGVCVQIIEHSESDLITKEDDNAAKKMPNEDKKKQTTSTSSSAPKDDPKPLDSAQHTKEQTAPPLTETTPKETPPPPMPSSIENSNPANINEPLPPAPLSSAKRDPKNSQQYLDKELASARSNYELVKKTFDTEIDNLPYGQTALVYLKRLFEHFVTHESGYASVNDSCAQTITVELYPLKRGWTAFARYSGTNREERVDQLFATELSQFAERAVLALLNDVPISTTIKRDNVLTSDSKRKVQQVKGSNHFTINIGTKLVGAKLNQVQTEGDNIGGVDEEYQLFHPMKFGLGYRGRFENWGLEVQTGLGIGVGKKAASSNPLGGHIDYGGDAGLAIHFLHYNDPRGLVSFYVGGGAGFDFMWLSAVNPETSNRTRSYLYTGGLSGDGVLGWEFLRAASVQFFIQGELNLPLYVSRSENNAASISSWMPGISFKLGVVF